MSALSDRHDAPPGPDPASGRPRTARPQSILARLLGNLSRSSTPTTPAVERAARAVALCHALLSERGEVLGERVAAEALAAFQSLDEPARDAFFDLLSTGFGPDLATVSRSAEAYCSEPTGANLLRLQSVVESPRQELFRRLNTAPGGTVKLVELRRRLLQTLREHPDRAGTDADLVHLFKSWFNRGFLVLERIDWRTSAFVLEKLIHYEAVHQIQGWDDLRRRLQADRRCYAFFHPALPEEPLIFIEVALTDALNSSVQPMLDVESAVMNPVKARYAIFYSITNCQEGLRGVSFGNYLIKQVVDDLGREFPRLRTFATLSPIPGFRRWLATAVADSAIGRQASEAMKLLSRQECWWQEDREIRDRLRRLLLPLGAHYLLHARQGAVPLDPVARFHLANGARLERLNWLGDVSEEGMRRAAGMTVNYTYIPRDIERNHEAYARNAKVIASRSFELILKQEERSHGRRAH